MAYNSHTLLRDFWSYDQIFYMPIRDMIAEVEYFTPKLKEIARRQEADRLQMELTGKRNAKQPGGLR